ncbi:hypothetical protein [Luteimonas sp. MHLX1A]|uniref:hypothetical protein n=1 Tax=Alterluteimonas muca TaxID=2878684 RepID=UPI001E4880BD|nr:hypothetical protein [Luteimonas sp. MHLX1A]MCD9046803.1 hypothetical protein [Luteimonas sp. MHLX1A]
MTTADPLSPRPTSTMASRDPVPFVDVVRALYGLIRDHVHTVLGDTLDDLRDRNPDDVRMEFDNAICEICARLGLGDDVETRGMLGEMVLDQEAALDEYLTETTEQ